MSHHASNDANIAHFKSEAQSYDSKESVQILTDMFAMSLLEFDVLKPRKALAESETPIEIEEVKRRWANLPKPDKLPRKLIHEDTKIIDLACGTGLVMDKLAQYMPRGEYHGIDISELMLAEFETKASRLEAKYPGFTSYAVCGDVLDENFDFCGLENAADVVLCSLAFHHFHNYDAIAQVLKRFAKPNGWVFIYDFYNEDVEKPLEPDLVTKGVSHHGLTLDQMNLALAENCHNVSSAREFRLNLWEPEQFISSHCCTQVRESLQNAPRRGDLFKVTSSIVLGIAQTLKEDS